jgi:hypothetical protein
VHGKELPRTVIKNNNTYKVILLQTNNYLQKLKLSLIILSFDPVTCVGLIYSMGETGNPYKIKISILRQQNNNGDVGLHGRQVLRIMMELTEP